MARETGQFRTHLYQDRWSSLGQHTGIRRLSGRLSVKELARFPIFDGLRDDLLEELSPDISVAEWEEGATLFEEGSYLDLAFYIVQGEVSLFLKKDQGAAEPIFSKTRQVAEVHAPGAPRRRDPPSVLMHRVEQQKARQSEEPDRFTYLSTMDFDLAAGQQQHLGAGEIFGEIGALNGWPQSVTARTLAPSTFVQIRVPALRKLKRKAKALKAQIDRSYRERTLLHHLKTTPTLRGLSDAAIADLKGKVELVSLEPDEALSKEGEPADAIYLVRSGFLRLSQCVADGEIVVTYLSKGMTLGDVEVLLDGITTWQTSAASVGHTELVRIAAPHFREVVRGHPAVERRLWEAAVARIKEAGYTRKNPDRAGLIEFSLAKGLVQGNSVLVMDLDVCTRCDDCVRGCASTHGGRPRFVREGERFGRFLVARSCYHCEDPVCLVGCPTGAIRRANVGEVVAIDDMLCIGCGTCADNCPYDAIVMHDTGETWPDHAVPERLRGEQRFVASKCDLCYTSEAGPACVSSCPHACAFRVGSVEEFDALLRGENPLPPVPRG
jgi:CRP-like cAMP-binding protein/Fe-S-cluster-containing dehydrogenase component